MQPVKLNSILGGNNMEKCSFCGKNFKPLEPEQTVCEKCIHSVEELTNGKGDDEDEDE